MPVMTKKEWDVLMDAVDILGDMSDLEYPGSFQAYAALDDLLERFREEITKSYDEADPS